MYRVPVRLARAMLPALSATFLLSGCMALGSSGPAALGAGTHRSIKDDPELPAVTTPAPKQAPAKMALVLPPPRPQPPRAAIPKRADAPPCASNSECMVRLKAMIDDPSRGWIGKPQSARRVCQWHAAVRLPCPAQSADLPATDHGPERDRDCGQHLPCAGARCHRRAGQARPGAQHRRRAGTAGGNRWPVQGLIKPGSSRSVQLCACDADHGAGRDRPAARFATACPAGSPPVRARRTHRP